MNFLRQRFESFRITACGCMHLVTRGHFRSRDIGGDHTIRSAIAENPLLYANCTALSFIEMELLLIEVLQCGNREFHVVLRKIVENVKIFCSHPKKDIDFAESRL